MTYIRLKDVTDRIPNKFEAIRIMSQEARRLNERANALGINLPGKITTNAVNRLIAGKIATFDIAERRRENREAAREAQE
jgi:DNA-directed RNA polymerase subunit K/omega